MEKKNYLLIVLVAILFLIIGGVGTYVIINNSNDNEPIVDNNRDNNKNEQEKSDIKIIETKNSCEDYTLGELVINGKQIDLGFKNDSDACSWVNITNYHVIKNNEIILLETYEGIVGDVVRLYFIDYNGNILLTSKQLNLPDDIHKIDINSNAEIMIEAYNYMQSPCYYYQNHASSIAGGTYKLKYLGKNKFSQIETIEQLTVSDFMQKYNLTCE